MAIVNIRVDEKIKKEFTKICDDMGLDVSIAVRLFLVQVILEQRIPFEIKTFKSKHINK